MKNMVIYPYKMASRTAKILAQKLDCFRVWPDRNFTHREDTTIINWGNGNRPDWYNPEYKNKWINKVSCVLLAISKIATFRALQRAGFEDFIPPYTVKADVAWKWFLEGDTILARKQTEGMGGAGIEVLDPSEQQERWPRVPLYTVAVDTDREFKIHVFHEEIIGIEEKRKLTERLENQTIDPLIKSEDGGWVYCQNHILPFSNTILELSINAVQALGLDFGAVDIGWNTKTKNACIFEINTAPGLDIRLILKYSRTILQHL